MTFVTSRIHLLTKGTIMKHLTITALVITALLLNSCGEDQQTQQPDTAPSIAMITIPAGTFAMGTWYHDGDERPVRNVTISRSFLISKYEVTQHLWKKVMGDNPSYFLGDSLPVENINWFHAITFCNKLSQKVGLTPVYTIVNDTTILWNNQADGYRLPTEAEWEYACRAGTTTEFYTGPFSNSLIDSALDKAGWYCGNAQNKTHPVGKKIPNNFGLYDMHGNVWEWVWDWFAYYTPNDTTDWVVSQRQPIYQEPYYKKMQRGGSYDCEGPHHYGRSPHRHLTFPEIKAPSFGLRVARNIQTTQTTK